MTANSVWKLRQVERIHEEYDKYLEYIESRWIGYEWRETRIPIHSIKLRHREAM